MNLRKKISSTLLVLGTSKTGLLIINVSTLSFILLFLQVRKILSVVNYAVHLSMFPLTPFSFICYQPISFLPNIVVDYIFYLSMFPLLYNNITHFYKGDKWHSVKLLCGGPLFDTRTVNFISFKFHTYTASAIITNRSREHEHSLTPTTERTKKLLEWTLGFLMGISM